MSTLFCSVPSTSSLKQDIQLLFLHIYPTWSFSPTFNSSNLIFFFSFLSLTSQLFFFSFILFPHSVLDSPVLWKKSEVVRTSEILVNPASLKKANSYSPSWALFHWPVHAGTRGRGEAGLWRRSPTVGMHGSVRMPTIKIN